MKFLKKELPYLQNFWCYEDALIPFAKNHKCLKLTKYNDHTWNEFSTCIIEFMIDKLAQHNVSLFPYQWNKLLNFLIDNKPSC